MASITTQINLIDRMSSPLHNITSAVEQVISSMQRVDGAINRGFDAAEIDAMRRSVDNANAEIDEMTASIRQADQQQQGLNQQVQRGQSAMGGLAKRAMGMVAAYASIQTIGNVMNVSDQMSQTEARLSLMVDDGGSVDALQDKIYASAQASRTDYMATADVVAKLGLRAGDAFGSHDETIQFAENLNKQFVIAGASQQEIASASLQLTQALGSGVLRGEELNAVFEAAPNVIQTIADYLDVPIGAIRNMASEGEITADIVKSAMLSATDEINADFNSMPITFSQAWTGIQNDLLNTFQPMLGVIAQGAGWIHNNWAAIEPVFWGLTAAVAAYALITAISAAKTWLAVAANRALIVTMLSNPVLGVAVAIGILVATIYQWSQSVGGVKIAWMIAMSAIRAAWYWVYIGLTTGIYALLDMLAMLRLAAQIISVDFQKFMGDMKSGTLMILQDMVNGAIDIINAFTDTINSLVGTSFEAIAHVTFGTNAELENQANKAALDAGLADYQSGMDAGINARAESLERLKAEAVTSAAESQLEIALAQSAVLEMQGGADYGLYDDVSTIANNTGAAAESATTSTEDLQYIRDLAEREAVNRYTTAEIRVDMGGVYNTVNSGMDLDGMVDRLAVGVNEAMSKSAEGVYT